MKIVKYCTALRLKISTAFIKQYYYQQEGHVSGSVHFTVLKFHGRITLLNQTFSIPHIHSAAVVLVNIITLRELTIHTAIINTIL